MVTETKRLQEPLSLFLQGRGITNGQVTRELFTAYNDQVKSSMGSTQGGFQSPGGFGSPACER